MGRPTKLTDDLAIRLVDALSILPIKLACDSVGIAEKTYHEWVKRAEEGEEPYATFVSLARESRARFVRGELEQLVGQKTCQGNWKAKAWYLERCLPDHFKQRTEQELTGNVPHSSVTIYIPANGRDDSGSSSDQASSGASGTLPVESG